MTVTALILVGCLTQFAAVSSISHNKISYFQRSQKTITLKMNSLSTVIDTTAMSFSTLQGQALRFPNASSFPTLTEIKSFLDPKIFEKNTIKSLSYAALDVSTLSVWLLFARKFILPLSRQCAAMQNMEGSVLVFSLWSLYSLITGTLAMGSWVTAHECGHKAFSNNNIIQDIIGYTFHSLVLVPYFSWQRSHAIHHAYTNHIEDGETHVPPVIQDSLKGKLQSTFGTAIGGVAFTSYQLLVHLIVGWPVYLMFGVSGGPSRGVTNHFVPIQFPSEKNKEGVKLKELFPSGQKWKVWLSDVGIVATLAGLWALSRAYGAPLVLASYGGPLLVINAWLVGYTWLQHTEVDVPHLSKSGHNYIKGAFHTVDRPYHKLLWGSIDFLHHHIGSTHVAHHVDSSIPHYNAQSATKAIKSNFPHLYLYESTPVFKALWRVASKCFQTEKRSASSNEDLFVYYDK